MTQAAVAGRASGAPWQAWPFGLRGARRLRHAPFSLFIVAILGYAAAFAWYTLDRFDLVNLIRDGYWDDAFYYFQIAYHMAEGRFSTFDGVVTRTNGYHPLWMFLLTPFYWAFDKTEALFAVKAFEIMLVAGGVALVAAAARVARLPWILLFAALPAFYAQRGMLWGMEAALVLFMLGLLMLATCLFARDPARWRWSLAAVAFALPWARLEWVAVAVAVAAALCLLEWAGRFRCSQSAAVAEGPPWRAQAAVPLAAAVAGVLVYFVYNGVVFGGIVPVSGAVKALWAQRLWGGSYDLGESIQAFARLEAFDGELLTVLEVCVYALLLWHLSRRSRSREDALLLAFVAGVLGLAAGHLAKFAHGVLSMHPTLLIQYEWYFVPAYLMGALLVPLRCWIGIYVLRRLLGPRWPRTIEALRLAAVVAAGAVLLAKADFAEPFRIVDRARDSRGELAVREYMGARVIDRLLPEGTLVGSWDSGVVGYFSRLPVVNLDGLASSYDYLEAMEFSVEAFWRRHGIFLFANAFSGEEGISWKSPRLWEEVVSFQQPGSSSQRTATSGFGFDLRVEEGHLVYAKEPCTRHEIAAVFFLHVVPVSRDDLPDSRKRDGFENLDFPFEKHGARLAGACEARVPLPNYEISSVRTGQVLPKTDFLFKAARGSRQMLSGLQFILYSLDPESLSSPVDRVAWFREKMAPHLEFQADGVGLLVEDRTAQAFAWECTVGPNDVAEWTFGDRVETISDWTQTADGLCASSIVLPHGHLQPVRVRRVTLNEALAGLVGGQPPAIRADSAYPGDAAQPEVAPQPRGFDVYLAEDALVYVKRSCEQLDTGTPFFVYLVPSGDDFDDGRESIGYNDYLHFVVGEYGDWLGEEGSNGPCVAEVPLPGYGLSAIRTGQYDAKGITWEGEIRLDQMKTEAA